jgi:hypothetical protein
MNRTQAVVAHCLSGEGWRVANFGAARAAQLGSRAVPAGIRRIGSGFRGFGAWTGGPALLEWGASGVAERREGDPGRISFINAGAKRGKDAQPACDPTGRPSLKSSGRRRGRERFVALSALTTGECLSIDPRGGSMGGRLRWAGPGLFPGPAGAIAVGLAAGSGAPRDEGGTVPRGATARQQICRTPEAGSGWRRDRCGAFLSAIALCAPADVTARQQICRTPEAGSGWRRDRCGAPLSAIALCAPADVTARQRICRTPEAGS